MAYKNRNNHLAMFFTAFSVFLLMLGLISGTYLTQQQTEQFTYSYENPNLSPSPYKIKALYTCPTTSSQTYGTLGLKGHEIENELPPDQNSDMNITLRGYEEVNEEHQLVNYGGDTDSNMPPVLGSFFTRIPSIVKTYRVHDWDFQNKRRGTGVDQNWPVSVIGLYTIPGENLVGLKAGREIGGGYILMVIFATPTTITFSYSDDESGYPIYLDNLCVDPNLVTLYNQQNAGGRHDLPAIRTGQVFGYGNGSDVRIAIRDTGSWMDPRSRKDWWQGFDNLPPPPDNQSPNPTQPVNTPVPTNVISTPTPTKLITTPTPNLIPSPTSSVPTNQPPLITPTPAQLNPTVNVSPTVQTMPSPTIVPTITLTPTPTKTLKQKITDSPVIKFIGILKEKVSQLILVMLP